jgi:hypothetical protein
MAENENGGTVGTISLRDFFAAYALAGLTAHQGAEADPEEVATDAYVMAEAMLAGRVQNNSE